MMSRLVIRRRLAHLLLLQMSVLQIFLGAATSEGADHYCRISQQHTMCATTGIGPACGGTVYARGVSDADAANITSAHNKFRAKVAQGLETRGAPGPQPQAADMMEFTWDEELATIAQRHADQCVFRHECSKCRSVERFTVGQNLYTQYQSNHDLTVNWDHAIMTWYYEVDKVPASGVARFSFNPVTGHYTQLVWGSTNKVGCGYTMYRDGSWYKKLYTCNYGPAGNYIGALMYQSGPLCSRCPDGAFCSAKYPGLCGAKDGEQTSSTFVSLTATYSTTPPLYNASSPAPGQPGIKGTECCPCTQNVIASRRKSARPRTPSRTKNKSSVGGSSSAVATAAASWISIALLSSGPGHEVLTNVVSVWSLRQAPLREDLDRVSVPEELGRQVTTASLAPIRNSLMVVLKVEQNLADANVEVVIRGFGVTEQLCQSLLR